MKVRADVWEKIAAHVRGTPVAGTLDCADAAVPVKFCVEYSELCDRLLATSAIPTLTVDVAKGWADVDAVVAQRVGLGL